MRQNTNTDNTINEFDKWEEKYKPIENPRVLGSNYFDTYSTDWHFIKNQDSKYVWTWCSQDGWDLVQQGFHFVNRFGYFVATVPYNEGDPSQYSWRLK